MSTMHSSPDARVKRLKTFFSSQKAIENTSRDDKLAMSARAFFPSESRLVLPTPHPKMHVLRTVDIDRARAMFDALARQVPLHRKEHNLLDIWAVTGLRRNEVRNAAVLAWLLNPRGSHGQGLTFLRAVLQLMAAAVPNGLELGTLKDVLVQTEQRPLGSDRDRVDIAVQAEGVLIFIEVKIDAPEGEQQVDRYREAAKHKAEVLCNSSGKPCRTIIAYLAPSRKFSPESDLLSITWTDVAKALISASTEVSPIVRMLVRSFANHARKF